MYVDDALADSYHHHYGDQLPDMDRAALREYVRQQERQNPAQVLAMSEYLLKNVYEGARLPDGTRETRDTWEKSMGVDVLRGYMGTRRPVRGVQPGRSGRQEPLGCGDRGRGPGHRP